MGSFSFKQFTVNQELCAMKVGTDGTLLGAWANVPMADAAKVLDIGTGTGLISLMVAQRYPQAMVTAIDIDEGAVRQATENTMRSPFNNRIEIIHTPLQQHAGGPYDAIVCNPPFFTDSLQCPDQQRNIARHTTTLTFTELTTAAYKLLAAKGEFSVVIPFDYKDRFDTEAIITGFFCKRVCAVKTTPRKPVRRYLLSYTKQPCHTEKSELIIGSNEYKQLTGEFYLK